MQGRAVHVQPSQARGACQQAQATQRAHNDRQAGGCVRGMQVKEVMVKRGHRGRGKAQHEPIESQVVKPPAAQGEPVVFVVAAFTMSAIQVLEPERVTGRLAECCFPGGRLSRLARRDFFPETPDPDRQCQHGKTKHQPEHQHQGVVRENGVEIAGQRRGHGLVQQFTGRQDGQYQEQHQSESRRQRQGQTVVLVELAKRRGPGKVGVGFEPDLGHGLRHVDPELVRRCVLTGMQTGATVVTQIGQVVQVSFVVELEPACHGRENGTEALAIAAGVADLQDAGDFCLVGREAFLVPGDRVLGGVATGQCLRFPRQGFKRLHALLLALSVF